MFGFTACAAEKDRRRRESINHRVEDAVLHPGEAYRGEEAHTVVGGGIVALLMLRSLCGRIGRLFRYFVLIC